MRKRSTIRLILAGLLLLGLSGCDRLPSWMGGGKKEVVRLPGERITVLPAGAAEQPEPLLKDLEVLLPPAQENAQWPQHRSQVNAASGNLAAKGDFSDVRDAEVGGGESFGSTLVIQPVVADGMVFAMDAVGNISAHSAADIETIVWSSRGVAEDEGLDITGGGLAYDDGRLYAVSGRGRVAALDARTGKEFWHASIHIPFRSAPTVADGRLFAVTIDNQLFAFDTKSGAIVWNHRGINEVAGLMNAVSPGASSGMVIVPYSSGELYALSGATGQPVWDNSLNPTDRTQATSVFNGIGGDPVIDGQVVFAVSSGGLMSVFTLSQGRPLWERDLSSVNTPWIAGDYLFMLTADNTLLCIVKYNGGIRWSTRLESFGDMERKLYPITWKGPVMVDGKLAVISSDGRLVLVNAKDGAIAATRDIPGHIYTAPVVAGGKMYLVGQDATLYSLQ